MVVVTLLIGLALGAAAAWVVARARATAEAAPLHAELAAAEARLAAAEGDEARVQALAAEALRRNNTSFLELAQTQLAPIRETLTKFERQTQELEQRRQRAYGSLTQQVQQLAETQERL